ncbi:MAG: hypothetical protein ACLQOO_26510 [Terriglobia bacterium]
MMDGFEQPASPRPGGSGLAEDTGPFQVPADRGEGPAELRARRRRALGYKGQTGPRSTRGKRRSSLNRVSRGLVPDWVAKDLLARGENPQEFRSLHRDLIGWLGPEGARSRVLAETLAEAWWEKIRRQRNWIGAGSCDCKEIDARIDDLLQRFVWAQRLEYRQWRYRLESVLGKGLTGPAAVRKRIEARVPLLGGKPPKRPRPTPRLRPSDPVRESDEALAMLKALFAVMGKSQESGDRSQNGEEK